MGFIALRNMKKFREREHRCLGTIKMAFLNSVFSTREETISFGLNTGVDRGVTQEDVVMEF